MPAPPFDPALLSTFLAVVESGRMSAAARTLHLSQPAVTAQVRKLEEALGTPLFVRSARGVAPTDAGLRLADHARQVHRLLDEAAADVQAAGMPGGPLVIAASTTSAAHLLPPLLAEFRATHRTVPVQVLIDNTDGVVEAVRAGRAPLGLVEGHTRAPGVRLEPFVDDEIVPVIGRRAPFTIRRAGDLETMPILWREAGSGTRAVVERALRRQGLRRRGRRDLDIELASTEALVGAAAAGLGVAFLSRRSIRAHLAAGLVQVVPGLDLVVRRTFCWTLPAGALSGTARRFYDLSRRRPPP
ncbi:MAG: LysR family transcriptional regulator [Acidobacteriota bacterium]|nr:LysR family transcriptional regulator [Acidobacteriota bacterium]